MEKLTVLFIFLIIILLCAILINFILSSNKIPRIIWTYWDGDIPDIIKKCIHSWKQYNPNHKIIILNNTNIPDFIKNLRHAKDNPTRRSDYIRLYILQRYGGIWMDASIICNGPLPIDYNSDFSGYYLDAFTIPELKKCSPVIESWFLACKKNNLFVKKWYEEFMKTDNYENIDDYLDALTKEGIQHKINIPNYLTIHISAQAVLQRNPCEFILNLLKAEDTAFKYLTDNEWNTEKSIIALTQDKYNDQPIIKLRGSERIYLESLDKNL